MLPSEMSAYLKSIKRKRKQGRARTARYRASANGQAKIAAYNKKKSTKLS
jgi:F0F1-type ATP synthase membrane subunit b/b'